MTLYPNMRILNLNNVYKNASSVCTCRFVRSLFELPFELFTHTQTHTLVLTLTYTPEASSADDRKSVVVTVVVVNSTRSSSSSNSSSSSSNSSSSSSSSSSSNSSSVAAVLESPRQYPGNYITVGNINQYQCSLAAASRRAVGSAMVEERRWCSWR
ncbi:hypothetical protein V1477_015834, partial [Vespula maculifrons]